MAVKRGKPLARRVPLCRKPPVRRRSVEQVSVELATENGKRTPRTNQRPAARHREDRKWREACLAKRGARCRSCGSERDVQVDHMVGRVGAARLAIEAGLPLCGDFGHGRCHPRKTAHQLLIERHWLDDDMIEWLREQGHAWWLPDGTVAGRHNKIFAELRHGGDTQ